MPLFLCKRYAKLLIMQLIYGDRDNGHRPFFFFFGLEFSLHKTSDSRGDYKDPIIEKNRLAFSSMIAGTC